MCARKTHSQDIFVNTVSLVVTDR